MISRRDAKEFALNHRVGRAIRRYREEADLSRARLAAMTGLSVTTIERCENGDQPMPLIGLVALADAFDVTLDDLVPVEVDEKESA